MMCLMLMLIWNSIKDFVLSYHEFATGIFYNFLVLMMVELICECLGCIFSAFLNMVVMLLPEILGVSCIIWVKCQIFQNVYLK